MLEFVREIQELVHAKAKIAIETGWAELRLEENDVGPSLHLEPMKLAAAPLEVYFDSELLVVCSPGRKGISAEFFSEDREEIKSKVEALAAAVVTGTYGERLRQNSSELVAEWPGPNGEGTEEALRTALIATTGGGWEQIVYEPY
jgi:hypothetical protein